VAIRDSGSLKNVGFELRYMTSCFVVPSPGSSARGTAYLFRNLKIPKAQMKASQSGETSSAAPKARGRLFRQRWARESYLAVPLKLSAI